MEPDFERAYETLLEWCRKHNFSGCDPFDALNSRLFQATPLRHSRIARLAWTQLFKRSPLNLRALALVPAQRNPKGTALFALAALANYRRLRTKEAEIEVRELLDDLLAMQLSGWSGAAWGYDFDWQSRAFFAPRGTPTVVPTAFAVRALVEAARDLNSADYLQTARDACDFILRDLKRTAEYADEVCFSYSPLDQTQVYNASLLAAESLASVGRLARETDLCAWATRATRYVVRRQQPDGSWAYGSASNQTWIDNFHTAFILSSISRILEACDFADEEFRLAAHRGYEFWRERFFLADGWPKYYSDRLYPVDAHSAGAAIAALIELQWLNSGAFELAEKIAHWAIDKLSSPRGFFYYQRRRFCTVRIPYMRWSEAWMAYGLARLLEAEHLRS